MADARCSGGARSVRGGRRRRVEAAPGHPLDEADRGGGEREGDHEGGTRDRQHERADQEGPSTPFDPPTPGAGSRWRSPRSGHDHPDSGLRGAQLVGEEGGIDEE